MLVDTTNTQPFQKKLRQHYQEQVQEFSLGVAVTSRSKIGYALANLYFALIRTSVPMKIFNSNAEALDWITSQQEQMALIPTV